MSDQNDARPAAFVAAWDCVTQANDEMRAAKFGSDVTAGLMLQMADVYARLASAPEVVGSKAAEIIVDREIASANAQAAAEFEAFDQAADAADSAR